MWKTRENSVIIIFFIGISIKVRTDFVVAVVRTHLSHLLQKNKTMHMNDIAQTHVL